MKSAGGEGRTKGSDPAAGFARLSVGSTGAKRWTLAARLARSLADGAARYDRIAGRLHRRRLILMALGWTLVVLWLAVTAWMKLALYRAGVSVGDVFLHANAYINTDLPDKLLYVASYQVERGTTTLLQDHFEPTTLLLLPFYRLFDSPLFLILFQALAPAVLVAALLLVTRRFGAPSWLALATALLVLYNPTFTHSVTDAVGGYRHDAQFLLYLPAFVTCFLLRRPVATIVFLLLFLGIKQNAAFYGMAFGGLVALLGLPFGAYRRLGLAVALLSAIYFVLAVFFVPPLIHSPNQYAAWGESKIGGDMFATAARGFIEQRWYQDYLYFIYAAGSLPFYLAGLLDVGMYSLLARPSGIYYDFNIVILFGFGTLSTLLMLRRGEASGNLSGARQPLAWLSPVLREGLRRLVMTALVGHLAIAVPWTGWMFRHVWAKSIVAAVRVSEEDKAAAWRMIDPACTVSPHDALLDRFHRLAYWIRPQAAAAARYLVTVDRALLSSTALERDPLTPFVAAHADRLQIVGRAGALTVWLDRAVPCLPWQK